MKILITGATGLIGKQLVNKLLNKGYSINILTRGNTNSVQNKKLKTFHWNPEKNIIDIDCLNEVKVIINLAGSPIAQLWTKSAKKSIFNSRINSVNLLVDSIKKSKSKITHFYCASAIGIYESNINYKHYEDSSKISNSFLGNTVKEWEITCEKLKPLGIDFTILRIGLVLSSKGGLLVPIEKSIRFYLGTWFGKGKNIYSWIHIDDIIDSIIFLVENNKKGVFNLVAPNPVTSKAFTLELSKILNKKILIPPIPISLIKTITGSMSELLLFSQYVSCEKLKSEGYNFKFNNLTEALKDLLK